MKTLLKITIFFIPFILTNASIDKNTQNSFYYKKIASPIENVDSVWVDSILNTLTIEQKIAQLFMLPVYSDKPYYYEKNLLKTVKNIQPGGIILMKGSPYKHVEITNKLQNISNIPLMVAIDGEWGVSMRIDSIINFPKAMALGAVKDDNLIYAFGKEVARQCKLFGIHINFAPVIDINNTYKNPIINIRAFGDNKYSVARKGLSYATGMQDNGILAVGKHFPGHGSTTKDSHKTLPVIDYSKKYIFENDLYPFKNLINNELGGIMVAHIEIPTIDNRPNRPASLSQIVINSILKKQLGFKGLVFTDALNMKGVTKYFAHGEIEVQAILAGNDVLLYPEDIDTAVKAITQAVKNGRINEKTINNSCRKILLAKKWFGLNNYKPTSTKNLVKKTNSINAKKLKQKLIEKSITLIKNDNNLLPFNNLDTKKILYISLGKKNTSVFNNYLSKYTTVDTIVYMHNQKNKISKLQIFDTLKYYTHIIIAQHGVNQWAYKNYKLSKNDILFSEQIAQLKPTVLSFFGNPYALRYYNSLNKFNSIIIGYSNDTLYKKFTAQALFGGIGVNGTLPVTISEQFKSGTSITYSKIRLKYTSPYEFGLPDTAFYQIDSIAKDAIAIKATPGCQILYVKNGKVIYEKNFGYHTYKKNTPVKSTDIYDIASVTKVTATTISLMKLYEENKVNLVSKLSKCMPELKHTDKKNIRINQILSHHSGLRPWIPFYKNTLDKDNNLRTDLYKTTPDTEFSIPVTENIYLRNDYIDTIFQAIIDTPRFHKKKYRYSDLGFYLIAKLINKKTGITIDKFASKNFYAPLGMNYTTYNPWQDSIFSTVPSEDDKIFRKQIINGYVNDPGAAMLGGISGHAGVFSNANDLAKLGQLFLNKGTYGNKKYFNSKTLDIFNKQYFAKKGNRRALGFDKPMLNIEIPGPTCKSASKQSFGHMGFTGTYFWVDPKNQSIYIFLSNRTFPDAENKKLAKHDIRTKIQQAFYDVFKQ